MIVVAGVLMLAAVGVAVAVVSSIAARHPDRAALVVVLGAAAGGVVLATVLLLAPLALLGAADPGRPVPAPPAVAVAHDPPRAVAGVGIAAGLLLLSAWLVRTGDWERPDERP